MSTRLADGIHWCLPRLREDGILVFAPWAPGQALESNRFGIPEPAVAIDDCLEADALDVVLAPLVGFDRRGHRLGAGGGWYDRSFAFRRHAAAPPLLVGVGYALQERSDLPINDWDVPMDLIATEAGLLDCRPATD